MGQNRKAFGVAIAQQKQKHRTGKIQWQTIGPKQRGAADKNRRTNHEKKHQGADGQTSCRQMTILRARIFRIHIAIGQAIEAIAALRAAVMHKKTPSK